MPKPMVLVVCFGFMAKIHSLSKGADPTIGPKKLHTLCTHSSPTKSAKSMLFGLIPLQNKIVKYFCNNKIKKM
jgi:hypothetical protein